MSVEMKFVDMSGPVVARIDQHIAMGIKMNAEDLLGLANLTVPEDSGALKESGRVIGGMARMATVMYGNAEVDYDVDQHENLSYSHPAKNSKTSKRGRRAKWLEKTAEERQVRLQRRFTRLLREGSGMKSGMGNWGNDDV